MVIGEGERSMLQMLIALLSSLARAIIDLSIQIDIFKIGAVITELYSVQKMRLSPDYKHH